MGNREGSLASRQSSTLSDISSDWRPSPGCPFRTNSVSRSSTDSESTSSGPPPSNNNTFHKLSGSCPDEDVLQTAAHKPVPIKQRKVSRAASAGRSRRGRGIPGMASFSSKGDVMSDGLKERVEETWAALHSRIPCSTAIGCSIYKRVFQAAPQLRSLFRIPEDVTDLASHPPFHRSAKLFASVIDLCVRNIHALESEMGPVLVMYGRRHYHYLRDYLQYHLSFRPLYLPLFAQSIIEFVVASLPEQEKTESMEEGWHALLGYVIGKIGEGYELERHRTASLRRKSIL